MFFFNQKGRKADKFAHFEGCCTNCGFVHLNMFSTLISVVAHFGHQRAVFRIDCSFTKTGLKRIWGLPVRSAWTLTLISMIRSHFWKEFDDMHVRYKQIQHI